MKRRRSERSSVEKRSTPVGGVAWTSLEKGEPIEIIGRDGVTHRGVVDDVMDDGSVLWLWQDEGRGRTFYLQSDGHEIHSSGPLAGVTSPAFDASKLLERSQAPS